MQYQALQAQIAISRLAVTSAVYSKSTLGTAIMHNCSPSWCADKFIKEKVKKEKVLPLPPFIGTTNP